MIAIILISASESAPLSSKHSLSKRGPQTPESWIVLTLNCPLEVPSSQSLGALFHVDFVKTDRASSSASCIVKLPASRCMFVVSLWPVCSEARLS